VHEEIQGRGDFVELSQKKHSLGDVGEGDLEDKGLN